MIWLAVTVLTILVLLQLIGGGLHQRRIEALEREVARLRER